MNPKPKVVCVGYCRTGTSSLMAALNELGFGPCYHLRNIVDKRDVNEIKMWYDLGRGLASVDDTKPFLKDYNSFLDFPIAANFDKLYRLYPDAKYILTTRDPAGWAKSMNATLLPTINSFKQISEQTSDPFISMHSKWYSLELEDKLFPDLERALLAHTQRVKETIPAEKLLVYDVCQGWQPLVEFLGVEKPSGPFPNLNTTDDYLKEVRKFIDGTHS